MAADILVERLNTRAQARFYLEHAGQDFEDYAREDDTYRRALDGLHGALAVGLSVQQVDRSPRLAWRTGSGFKAGATAHLHPAAQRARLVVP